MTKPTTRAEAKAAGTLDFDGDLAALAESVETEFVSAPAEFLPLAVRRVLYILGLTAVVAAPVLAVSHPDYAAAIYTGGGILTAAGLGTALANPSR